MPRHLRFRASTADAGRRLDQFLAAHAPELSRGAVRKLIDEGAAYVQRRRLKRASHLVQAGDLVELYAPAPQDRAAPAEVPLHIVHEDEDILVVDKPAGIAVQARRESDAGTLEWAVKRRQRAAGRRAYVGIVHRLDQPASGLVVLALRPGAAAKLSRAFAAHAPTRKYLAVVQGAPASDALEITLPIAATAGTRRMRTDAAGKPAHTRVRVLARAGGRALVEAELATGRTHQIRVHLATSGVPIVGDRLYGGPPAPRLALHAAALGFVHPRTGRRIELESPLPADLTALLA